MMLPLLALFLHAAAPSAPARADTVGREEHPGRAAAVAVAELLTEHHLPISGARLEFYANATGTRLLPRLVGVQLPDSLTDAVLLAIQQQMPDLGAAAPRMSGYRLDRLDVTAAEPKQHPGSQALAPPQFANLTYVRWLMGSMLMAAPSTEAERIRRLRESGLLSVDVDKHGHVAAAVVERATGDMELDRYLLELAWSMEFRPARLDGTPVPMWVTIPLGFFGPA